MASESPAPAVVPRLPAQLNTGQLALLAGSNFAVLAWSRLGAFDADTWWMEVAPVLLVWPVLLATQRRFPLTPLLLGLIFVHALILIAGGHYSYARVPLGECLREWLALGRNPYDGIGHLAQGFIPAIAARELLLRKTGLQRGGWLFTVVTACCLAISAIYELIEWAAAIALGQGADEFLGAQGDPWDTQKDMALAWLGAMLAQVLLARAHDRALARLPRT